MEAIVLRHKSPRLPIQDPQFWQHYSMAEQYFFLALSHLIKTYGKEGKIIGHDTLTLGGVPSFHSFKISKRLCKSARKKLEAGGVITCKCVYGERGHRIGTEYSLCEVAFRESPKEIHALIFDKKPMELSTPTEIPSVVSLISP